MVKVVPVSVTVTTLMAVTLFMDSADVRLAGWVSIPGCLGPQVCWVLYPTGNDPWLSPTGTRCHLPCSEGFWGANCSNTCTCKNGGTCIPENGNCVCAPGFRGPSCQRREAHCPPAPPVSSSDLGTTPPTTLWVWPLTPISRIVIPVGRGGQGSPGQGPPSHHTALSSACPPGRYGKRCVPCKCNNHSSCHPSDGTCSCLAGWTGPDCSEGE